MLTPTATARPVPDVEGIAHPPGRSPKCLILDEPTEGIQPLVVHELEETITALTERGNLGVLPVEQHIGFALESSQRYYILEGRPHHQQGCSVSEADVRAAKAI